MNVTASRKKLSFASFNSKCPELAKIVYMGNVYELVQSKSFRA